MQPRGSTYSALSDGRRLCPECRVSAIMDVRALKALEPKMREFSERLGMKVHQRTIPLHLVNPHEMKELLAREEKNVRLKVRLFNYNRTPQSGFRCYVIRLFNDSFTKFCFFGIINDIPQTLMSLIPKLRNCFALDRDIMNRITILERQIRSSNPFVPYVLILRFSHFSRCFFFFFGVGSFSHCLLVSI